MVKESINIIINELNKHDLTGACVLASYLIHRCVPNSEIVKGFLIREKFTVYMCGLNIIKKYTILPVC